jgi:hypothetical protein
LIEKVRTNLLLQSQIRLIRLGLHSNASETGGQAGYDGSNDAWLLDKNAAQGRVIQSISQSGIQTLSVYAKKGTSEFLRMFVNGPNSSIIFNLNDGSVQNSSSIVSGKSTDVGGGWYRCEVAFDGNTAAVNIYPAESGGTAGTSGNVYIQDAQLETGDIATDYIATTSAAVSVGPVANLPRLDYLGSSCPRLLLEPQRTNLQYSESFNTSSSWSLSRTSAFGSGSVANAVTSPDGYTNAEYIQQATGETDGGGCFQGISYTSGTTYTLSVFAKQGENRYVRIGFGIGSGGAGIFCGFDLQDGIAGTPDTGVTAKIENYGNGWYRCSITATAQITGARNTFVYQSSNLNSFCYHCHYKASTSTERSWRLLPVTHHPT